MLVVFPPIFVADTKIIYGYNFVAPVRLTRPHQFNFRRKCVTEYPQSVAVENRML